MARFEHSEVIEAGVDDVFAFVTRVDNNLRWQPSLLEAAAVTHGPVGVGSRFWERRRVLGVPVVSEYVIEDFDPPWRCAARSVAGPLSFRVVYRLRATAGATVMSVEGDVTKDAILGLAARAATRAADREVAANLRTLKRVLEDVTVPVAEAVT